MYTLPVFISRCTYILRILIQNNGTFIQIFKILFTEEVQKYGLTAYKFSLPNSTYYRKQPSEEDCYKGEPPLLDGLSDVSKCYYGKDHKSINTSRQKKTYSFLDFPMAASFPHFLHGDENLKSNVDGLAPNGSIHDSFVIVEPVSNSRILELSRAFNNFSFIKYCFR